MSEAENGNGRGLIHVGLFYQDLNDLAKASRMFVEEGLESDEPVLIAQPPAQLNRLRDELPAQRDVTYVDMTIAGRNPGRILPWVLHDFVLRNAARRVRIIGEPIWPNRSALAYPACVQHEGLINVALGQVDAAVLCPYDIARLPPHAIDDSHLTHPLIQYACGPVRRNREYTPQALARVLDQPLEPPPPGARTTRFSWTDLLSVREQVAERAIAAGLVPSQVAAAKLAVSEAATNAVRHGGGYGTLSIWSEPEYLVLDVHSPLPMRNPLAGRLQPLADSVSGRGLALINHVCDLVRLHATARLGTNVRMWMHTAAVFV
ncbi:MAG TPA: anti-sigma factor RsbA family regulatory protein [Candidatus Limnocylindrales bacterium]